MRLLLDGERGDGGLLPEGGEAVAQVRALGPLAQHGRPDVGAAGQRRVLADGLERRGRGQPGDQAHGEGGHPRGPHGQNRDQRSAPQRRQQAPAHQRQHRRQQRALAPAHQQERQAQRHPAEPAPTSLGRGRGGAGAGQGADGHVEGQGVLVRPQPAPVEAAVQPHDADLGIEHGDQRASRRQRREGRRQRLDEAPPGQGAPKINAQHGGQRQGERPPAGHVRRERPGPGRRRPAHQHHGERDGEPGAQQPGRAPNRQGQGAREHRQPDQAEDRVLRRVRVFRHARQQQAGAGGGEHQRPRGDQLQPVEQGNGGGRGRVRSAHRTARGGGWGRSNRPPPWLRAR